MTQTTVELSHFLRAVAQDAAANETVRAAAAQGPKALEACLLPMLPVLMHERLGRDAVHAMSVLKRMEPNFYNATGLNEDSIATALMQDVYREIRQA